MGPSRVQATSFALPITRKGLDRTALLNLLKLLHFVVFMFLFYSSIHSYCSIHTTELLSLHSSTMFNFSWFKSSSNEDAHTSTWNPNTLAMDQPSSPAAPAVQQQQQQQVVTEQPVSPLPVSLYV